MCLNSAPMGLTWDVLKRRISVSPQPQRAKINYKPTTKKPRGLRWSKVVLGTEEGVHYE